MKTLIALALGLAIAPAVHAEDEVQGIPDALRAEHGFPGLSVAWAGPDGTVEMRAGRLWPLSAV